MGEGLLAGVLWCFGFVDGLFGFVGVYTVCYLNNHLTHRMVCISPDVSEKTHRMVCKVPYVNQSYTPYGV